MRKIILITMAAVFAVSVMAQQKMRVWKNNSLAYEEDVTQIDSITFYNENEGTLIGEFSVSSTQTVRFSRGNLQYQASTDTWRFAENQWDFVGEANENISSTYDGWIDLFGWGTGDNPTLTSTEDSDYSFYDEWGVNAISNGGNSINTWRSMTYDEWQYVFSTRTNANNLRGQATVNNVYGMIILPDSWSIPEGLTFSAYSNDFTTNVYSEIEWARMESAGAIFLPCAGRRGGVSLDNPGYVGHYSSSTPEGSQKAGVLYFKDYIIIGYDYRHIGLSVRLIQDIK